MTRLDYAIDLARRGFHVFPLARNTKVPYQRDFHWQTSSTTSPAVIAGWFTDRNYNIGIDCGKSGLLVVDCDVKTGLDGRWAYVQWLAANGLQHPDTLIVDSPSGGSHVYYRTTERVRNSAGLLAPGVDIRAAGGYIVGIGSTIDGRPYGIHRGFDRDIEDAPPQLIEALRPKLSVVRNDGPVKVAGTAYGKAALQHELEALAEVQPGGRNHALNASAFRLGGLVAVGALDRDDVFESLFAVSTEIGLGERESVRTIESGLSAGERQPRALRVVEGLA